MFTIDASVWVNAYSPAEPQQAASHAFLTALFASGTPIVVPTLLPVELAGVIARTRGDSDLAEKIAAGLHVLPLLRWVALDELFAEQAFRLAARHRLRGADAVYAAVAMLYNCDLVSLDHEHLGKLGSVVRTMTPVEAIAQIGRSRSQP